MSASGGDDRGVAAASVDWDPILVVEGMQALNRLRRRLVFTLLQVGALGSEWDGDPNSLISHTYPTLIPHLPHTYVIHTYILFTLSGWPRSRIRPPSPPRSTGRRPTPPGRPPPPPPRPRGDGDRFRRTREVGPACNQFDNIFQSPLLAKMLCNEVLCMRVLCISILLHFTASSAAGFSSAPSISSTDSVTMFGISSSSAVQVRFSCLMCLLGEQTELETDAALSSLLLPQN